MKTKFSGKKSPFSTGATREVKEGKGRFDLISPQALRQLAIIYENGAKNHSDWNWLQGFPYSAHLDSALRHINQFRERQVDENHLAQAAWHLFALMTQEELNRKDLDDRPQWTNDAAGATTNQKKA